MHLFVLLLHRKTLKEALILISGRGILASGLKNIDLESQRPCYELWPWHWWTEELQAKILVYTFVNTFDYTNAAGVKIDNDPLHALQLSPGVKFIGNTNTGWQPYLAFSMVWNLMDNSSATANGVKLPSMSVKPYVQYGVGVQKRVKDRFMAYGQAMIQNGGRNGLSLTAGFRWAIGRKSKSEQENQKVLKPFLNNKAEKKLDVQPVKSQVGEKKVLKQLSPVQKAYLGSVKYNSSRSVNTGILKQL